MSEAALSTRLAGWAADAGGFPAATIERARAAFVDVMACIIAGAADPTPAAVSRAVARAGGDATAVLAPALLALMRGLAAIGRAPHRMEVLAS